MPMLVLASQSPRRHEIMEMLPWDFEIDAKETDEQMNPELSLEENITNLAYNKAKAVVDKHPGQLIIGGDTIVLADGQILGKPKDDGDAKMMLELISRHTHYVVTGVCILCPGKGIDIRFVEKTAVYMSPLEEDEIQEYIQSKEPYGKAGAYAIQGRGGRYIQRIEGDYYNVVGLPLNHLYLELKKLMPRFDQGE